MPYFTSCYTCLALFYQLLYIPCTILPATIYTLHYFTCCYIYLALFYRLLYIPCTILPVAIYILHYFTGYYIYTLHYFTGCYIYLALFYRLAKTNLALFYLLAALHILRSTITYFNEMRVPLYNFCALDVSKLSF